jgi:hypothetical protein
MYIQQIQSLWQNLQAEFYVDGLIDRHKNFSSNLFQAHGLYVKDLGHAIRIRFTWYGLIGLGSESIRQIFIIYF